MNVTSFSSVFGATSPVQAIIRAADSWTYNGGYRGRFDFGGTTTWAGCGIGNPDHVYGTPGCNPGEVPACTTLAWNLDCPLGGTELKVFLGSALWSLSPSLATDMDFELVMAHEFGHFRTGTHIDPGDQSGPCVMNPSIGTGNTGRRYGFCLAEIEQATDLAGHPAGALSSFQSSGFPTPTSWAETVLTAQYGLGLADFWRPNGVGSRTIVRTKNESTSHSAFACLAGQGNCTPEFSTGISSLRRPTLVLDPTRLRWWLFAVMQGLGTNQTVAVASSANGTNWTFVQALPNASTRFPVAATFDPLSDRIVVVWNNATPGAPSIPNCSLSSTGCHGDYNLTSFAASSTTALLSPVTVRLTSTGVPLSDFGFGGHGSPAINCDKWPVPPPPGSNVNCEVWGIGRSALRALASFKFGITSGGAIHSQSGSVSEATVGPPVGVSVVGRRVDGTGAIVMAGVGNDHQLYVRSKLQPSLPWSVWQSLGIPGGTSRPPVVRVDGSFGQYEILTARDP